MIRRCSGLNDVWFVFYFPCGPAAACEQPNIEIRYITTKNIKNTFFCDRKINLSSLKNGMVIDYWYDNIY